MRPELAIKHREVLPDHDVNLLADVPTVFHCHHFNLSWDQTIDDALGSNVGTVIRTHSARDAFYELLVRVCQREEASTPQAKFRLAEDLFAAMGHGRLKLALDSDAGKAEGRHLHYGSSWVKKYGGRIERRTAVDAVAAGFIAAATELALGLPRQSARCRETECIAMHGEACRFKIERGDPAPRSNPIRSAEIEAAVGPPMSGLHESEIQPMVEAVRVFSKNLVGDDRGVIEAFGLFITLHLSAYYGRAGFDAYRHVARKQPTSAPTMRALLRECGHLCVFNTFGGILGSADWAELFGPPRGQPEEIIQSGVALARAFGFGRWTIEALAPFEHLVLRCPSTYESAYYLAREGLSEDCTCFFFQGGAVALLQLAHGVKWRDRPRLDQTFYERMFAAGVPWRVQETRCIARGDPCCEVVVHRAEPAGAARVFAD